MTTVNMVAPAGVNLAYGISGTQYNPGASGMVSVQAQDVVGLLEGGWQIYGGNQAPNASGLTNRILPLTTFKNPAGTTLAASASSGEFGISNTPGTSGPALTGEVANDATVTDSAIVEFQIPNTYVAGQNLNLAVDCEYANSSGTLGTHTLAAAAYLCTPAGAQGANLVSTAAQNIGGTTAGVLNFSITGASLTPGARLMIELTTVMQTTTAGSATSQINQVQIG